MRNYNSKQHTKPLVQNAFKKTDRKYPQSTQIGRSLAKKNETSLTKKNQTSLEKDKEVVIPKFTNLTGFTRVPVIPSHTNHDTERYYLILQQPFQMNDRDSQSSYTDPYCLWFRSLDKQPIKKKRLLRIKKVNYTITDWAEDFYPMTLFICVTGLWGYLNQHNVPTERIMALQLKNQAPQVRNSVQITDLLYQSASNQQWVIPQDLTQIYLYICDQNNAKVYAPLPNPMTVQVEIKRQ